MALKVETPFPIYEPRLPAYESGAVPRITSLLIKPASAVCNLDCEYCFYLDRDADPYTALPGRRMTTKTLERLVETYLVESPAGPPRKYYRLTEAGTASLASQRTAWASFTQAMQDILGGAQ